MPHRLVLVLLLLIAVLSVFPTLRLLFQALMDLSAGENSSFIKVFSQSNTWRAFWNSLLSSFLAMLVSLFLGLTVAFLISLTDIRGKAWWIFLFMLPMMLPPQVMALSWLQLMGPNSVLLKSIGMAPALGSPQPLYSLWGIVLLMGIQHAPLVFLILRVNLAALPADLMEAARLSGAGQRDLVFDMVLPLCKNAIWAAAAMSFMSGLGNFGIPAMLGIPVSYYVLPTLIYQKMSDFGQGMINEVANLSLLVALLAGVVVWVQHHFQSKILISNLSARPFVFKLGAARGLSELLLFITLLLILVVPLLALLSSSLVPVMGVPLTFDNYTFKSYEQIFMSQSVTWRAFKNSFVLSVGAALVIAVMAILISYYFVRQENRLTRFANALMDMPYAFPGVVLAIACILLFAKPLPLINYTLYGTLWILFFAYLSRFLCVGFKPVHSSMLQIDVAMEEAAQLCGATFWQRLRDIVLPLSAPAAFAGFILVFLIAFNELTVSALLWSARRETIGVLIFNMEESGEVITAAAVSVVVVALVLMLMLALNLMAKRLPKGVIPWQS
ncbi:ABC transporter permease [Oligella urethralis DNF00040]|uniref:ABC transporter permease n=1 Tax=Oligella urethralis DNF00040 TaxID=1401065 RepID=A0A095ZE53_9BURK|nr:ABC transporter permease [Oligella urethralis DNF00040]